MYKKMQSVAKDAPFTLFVTNSIATVDIQGNAERGKSRAVHSLVTHSIATVDVQVHPQSVANQAPFSLL